MTNVIGLIGSIHVQEHQVIARRMASTTGLFRSFHFLPSTCSFLLPASLPAFFPLFPSPPLADSVFNRPFSLQSRPFRLFFFPRLAQCSSH